MNGKDVKAEIWARFNYDMYWKNDKVDKDIYEETWNENMNYLKVVTTKPLQRLALIGINYLF